MLGMLEKVNELSYNKILEDMDKSIAEYKKTKEEMARLGFTDYSGYLDYLEHMGKEW